MLQIAKYCSSGNDFVIFHAFEKADRSILAQTLCDRQNGIGADGLIVLIPHPEYDFEWEFYNADGSTASKKSAKRLSRTSKTLYPIPRR